MTIRELINELQHEENKEKQVFIEQTNGVWFPVKNVKYSCQDDPLFPNVVILKCEVSK